MPEDSKPAPSRQAESSGVVDVGGGGSGWRWCSDGAGPVTVDRFDPAAIAELSDAELLRVVLGFYRRTLTATTDATAMLARRRIGDDVIQRFGLGFANRSLPAVLPGKSTVAGREVRARLQAIGILRSSGHELFRGSLVVPITDGDGRLVKV